MKNHSLFSSEDKSKKIKCRLLQVMFGALRINIRKYFPFQTGFINLLGRRQKTAKISL